MKVILIYSYNHSNYCKIYFIDNKNYIIYFDNKSTDPKNNPTEFDYKLTDNSERKIGNIKSIQEFGIEGIVKFIRATVQIDRSPWKLESLSKDKEPVWSEETLFLKVLIEGKASLYHFKEGSLDRFFYSVNNPAIVQLICKEYMISNSQSSFNNKFRQQLASELNYPETNMNELANLNYGKKALIKYFENYNNATGQTALKYGEDGSKDLIHLKLTPGISSTTLIFNNRTSSSPNSKFEFGTKLIPRIGIELEFVIPWHMKTWSVIFEPTFQYFNATSSVENSTSHVEYSSIDIPLGLRHNFSLKKDMKLFIDGFFFYNSPFLFKSTAFLSNSYYLSYKLFPSINMAFGVGIDYKRLSFETRYNTNRNLMLNDHNWKTGYTKLEFVLGIKVL